MPFCDTNEIAITTIDSRAWISPDFLLQMKQGDIKSHVMLLCNIFLGLMTDAYVVLGYAKSEPSREAILSMREKAREEKWNREKKRMAFEQLRGVRWACTARAGDTDVSCRSPNRTFG